MNNRKPTKPALAAADRCLGALFDPEGHMITVGMWAEIADEDKAQEILAAIIEETTGLAELIDKARGMLYAPSDDPDDYPDIELFGQVMSAAKKLKSALAKYEEDK